MDLEEMLDVQREFEQEFMDPESMTQDERQRWVKEFILNIMDQSISLLNTLDWKEHRPYRPVDYDDVMQELVDIQKYVLAIHVALNVKPDEYEAMFRERSNEVVERYREEMK